MSLLAGIYSMNRRKPIDRTMIDAMKNTVVHSDDHITTFSQTYFSLIKFDFGLFGEPGYLLDKKKGIAAIAGEPILVQADKESFSRFTDLDILLENLFEGKIELLKSCHGTYTLCYYNPSEHSIMLAADKLGGRPLYYYSDDDFLYFASSLKILEALENIPKRMNLQAFVEQQSFYYPLGTRTPYCDIKLLRDGQYIHGEHEKMTCSYYFRLDQLPTVPKSQDEILHECYLNFRKAIVSRCHGEDRVFAFLSGGLDSRCLIAVLHSLEKEITAFNSSRPGEKDGVFAEQYATRLKIQYITSQYPPNPSITTGERTRLALTGTIKRSCQHMQLATPPNVIFSADGGGEVVGFLQIDEHLLNLLRAGDIDQAIHHFLHHITYPERILRPNVLQNFKTMAFNGMKEELKDLVTVEPEKAIYLFLLRNDLRCHLHDYHDHIDEHRVELRLPFYDARLVETLASISEPLTPYLYHNFYHQWLQLFPEPVRSIPWQTYPDHLPCPLPEAQNIPSQWEIAQKDEQFLSKLFMKKCLQIIMKRNFPDVIVDRYRVWPYFLLQGVGVGNYSYVFKFCLSLYNSYSRCTSMDFNC